VAVPPPRVIGPMVVTRWRVRFATPERQHIHCRCRREGWRPPRVRTHAVFGGQLGTRGALPPHTPRVGARLPSVGGPGGARAHSALPTRLLDDESKDAEAEAARHESDLLADWGSREADARGLDLVARQEHAETVVEGVEDHPWDSGTATLGPHPEHDAQACSRQHPFERHVEDAEEQRGQEDGRARSESPQERAQQDPTEEHIFADRRADGDVEERHDELDCTAEQRAEHLLKHGGEAQAR